MTQLLDIFGFLAVILRGLILALQSMVGGGLVFALFIDRGDGGEPAARACRRLLLGSALGLAVIEAGNVAADAALLMGTADLRLAEVSGANFFVAGSLGSLLAILIAIVVWRARPQRDARDVMEAQEEEAAPTPATPASAVPADRLAARRRRRLLGVALALAVGLLAASVATSHAAARLDDRLLPLVLTALHQAATACWIGGLPYLLLTLRRAGTASQPADLAAPHGLALPIGGPGAAPGARADAAVPGAAQRVAARFSRLAQVSVAVLLFAGLGLAWMYVGSPAAVLGTAYGVMVSAKVTLFVLLLGLGALNYSIVHGSEAGRGTLLTRLGRFSEAEIGIGFTVILAAASLTSQPPASDLARDQVVPLAAIASRMAPQAPRFVPPPADERLPPAYRTPHSHSAAAAAPAATPAPAPATTPATAPAAAPQAYSAFVPGQLVDAPTPGEIALSEFNHNVSGLVVLLAGLGAVAARAGWRWARNWPLAFLGLAVFLFLLADVEYWPLGPVPFWRSFLVSEALQHRLAVLLIVAFAIFERQVQTGHAKAAATALVFPFVCFLGGALLLTHSHSLVNPQAELLAELSHVPIAILGVAAGWSRWLELRLDGGPRRALSWVWPICLILVGLVLLDYREA